MPLSLAGATAATLSTTDMCRHEPRATTGEPCPRQWSNRKPSLSISEQARSLSLFLVYQSYSPPPLIDR
ncbi:hypothetical protein F2Q69_00021659 [Brassica cretica]|uniref:Uncharacterized protein n=1 Tax=Brassica cretica TaxID=69181 RepID=A0A8S9QT38_BRACR|nr:hypothetical protein F2Q69_00021659 [Brassica cretica]